MEGVVIVLSILLAFGIDAWWDGKAELRRTHEHLRAVRFELSENIGLLDEQAEVCEQGQAASDALLSLMRPNPEPVPPDSLLTLMSEALYGGIGNRLSTTALSAMIAEGQFAAIESAELQRGLGDWLSSAVDQRVQQRENTRVQLRRTWAYVETVMPFGLIATRLENVPDRRESQFPFVVDRVLSDATLEGSLHQLGIWRNSICLSDSTRRGAATALLALLDAELAR